MLESGKYVIFMQVTNDITHSSALKLQVEKSQKRTLSDVCGQVCANGFEIDMNSGHCAGNIYASLKIDDIVKPEMTAKNLFLF